jgi:hypothetical protein
MDLTPEYSFGCINLIQVLPTLSTQVTQVTLLEVVR